MKLIRATAAQIVSRRKKLVAGLLVALAGSGGLAARAWQDAPAEVTQAQPGKAEQFPTSVIAGQARPSQFGTPASQVLYGQQPSGATTVSRFPTPARASGFGGPSWETSYATAFFARPQSREAVELDQKIGQLLSKQRQAPDASGAIQQELEKLLEKQFDLRHAAQTQQIDKLKASLAEAEQALATREENREQIIERRAKQLLGQSDPLGWEYELQTGSSSRLRRSPSPTPVYGLRSSPIPQYLPADRSAAAMRPVAPIPPSQAPTSFAPPNQAAPGTIQSRSGLPGMEKGEDDSYGLVLKAQLDAAKEQLNTIARLHAKEMVSSSQLSSAESQVRIMEAKLKSQVDKLKLEVASARIDLDAQHSELKLLMEETQQSKNGSQEAFSIRRALAQAEAALRKTELKMAQKVEQLEQLEKLINTPETEHSYGSDDAKSELVDEEA